MTNVTNDTSKVANPPGPTPVVLDVRPIFAGGGSPCALIESTAASVTLGQRFVLLVPFEPVPLYAKLGRGGLERVASAEVDGSWRIEFRRVAEADGPLEGCGCSGAA